jgi:hypothetical protein
MQHQHCPKAIDRILHEIYHDDRPFGGLTIVFGGDFCKNFLVIVKGSKGQIITSSFQRSSLWHNILKLQQNMCLLGASLENQQFANWSLEVGSGHATLIDLIMESFLFIDQWYIVQTYYHSHKKCIMIFKNSHSNEYFKDHIILFTPNDIIDSINNGISDIFP